MKRTWDSPVGRLLLTVADDALVRIDWTVAAVTEDAAHPVLDHAIAALEVYFAGRPPVLDFRLRPDGSDFQKAVWRAMLGIPYGETRTYGDLAAEVDGIARAVGTACGANPIPILIPCHRVTAADGRLGGFSGGDGRDTKRRLLAREQQFRPHGLFSALDG